MRILPESRMSDIKNFDIRTYIIDAIVDVFNSMVSMAVEFSDSEPPDTIGTGRMVATVSFAGKVAGLINIQIDSALSRLMMAGMLDIEPEEVEDDGKIKDLLAEISHIVGGNLKSALNDDGHRCVISTPSITYGADFSIKPLKMERFERFIFTHQENYIFVEVGLNTQQASGDEDELGAPDAHAPLGNAVIAKINALDINAQICEAVIDVFDTMLSLKLEPVDAVTAESLEGIRNAGSVSFAGDATGMVSIHAGDSFSREMAAAMLGMEVEGIEGDEEIRDMLAEMGNIVAGNLTSAFTDAGLMCALSTPSVTSGTDFKIEALNLETYERFAFRCGENIIFVEMGAKVSEQPQISIKPDETKAAEPDQTEENIPAETQDSKTPEDVDLDLLLDVPLEIKAELGRARIKIRKLLNLTPGSAIKLIKLEGEPVDILVNDTLIARGEVVVQNEKYGIRVTEITSRMDRIRSFGI
jgi:flagellar motor switch protein FliN/FliY